MFRLDYRFLSGANWGKGCYAEDYLLLAGIIANLKPRTILEIGTSTGLGAMVMASVLDDVRVTTIDPNQASVESNIHLLPGIRKRITFVKGASDALLPSYVKKGRKFDLVLVDGDHSKTQATHDWENTQELTSIWVFHDTSGFTGLQWLMQVIRATNQYDVFQFLSATGYRRRKNKWDRTNFVTGLTIVQHRGNLGILAYQAQRGDDGKLLPGHSERSTPNLRTLFR